MHFSASDRIEREYELSIKGCILRKEHSRAPASQQSGAALRIYISSFIPFENVSFSTPSSHLVSYLFQHGDREHELC